MSATSAHEIAQLIRSREPGIGILKLHKLLYYVQGWHLALYDEPAFTEQIEAWEHGPVVATLWRDEKYGYAHTPRAIEQSHITTVACVHNRYGRMTGKMLEEQTHGEAPWVDAGCSPGYSPQIPVVSLKVFFAEQPDQEWFWDDEWQSGEREADEDIRLGRVTSYDDVDDFVDSL